MDRSESHQAPQRQQHGEDIVRHAVRDYASRFPELTGATDRFAGLITRMLDDAGINYLSITGRTKSVASFAGKAMRQDNGAPLYSDPLREITDQLGVRVITYLAADVAAVADLVSAELTVLDDRDMGRETAAEGQWGYASRHILVSLGPAAELSAEDEVLRGHSLSLQVRTILQHAWAEFEHDIRYKGHLPEEHAPDLNRRFTLAAGLLELADREFTAIRDRIQATLTDQRSEQDPSDPRIGAQELAAFLAGKFADAGWSKTDHYAWISGLLLELGITSRAELGDLLASVDSAAITDRMGYRYPPGAVRRLDDALLAVFGAHYVALHGNDDRRPLLQERLNKLSD